MARLQEFYKETVMPELQQKFSYKSVMEVPRITKITLNMGVGEAVGDKKVMEHAVGDMTKIAGQKPVVTVARKAIARKTGARGLRSILEGILLDTMYELPTYDGVEEVVVNAEVVEGRSQPLLIYAERRDKGGAA